MRLKRGNGIINIKRITGSTGYINVIKEGAMKKLLYGIGFVVLSLIVSCLAGQIFCILFGSMDIIATGNIIGFMMPAAFVVPAIYLNVAERK